MEETQILKQNLDQIQGELINLIQTDNCKLLKTTKNFEIIIPNREDPTKVYFKHSSADSSSSGSICDRSTGVLPKYGVTNYKKYPMRSDVRNISNASKKVFFFNFL